jgi:gamma-glutamyltranspeptidase
MEQKYKAFENSQVGCKDAEEVQLRNESMKRMAIMRQKKIILNDYIRVKKKEMLREQ